MRYALVDGEKSEARPKLKGLCPNCNFEMVARCGRVKVWHWAHKGRPPCDPWWESETEWHRNWKNNFPIEWQEVCQPDPVTGEKHIADVKNPFGLVVELQHSPLDLGEMRAREKFYREMVWIVDGTRNPLDVGHFKIGLEGPIKKDPLVYRIRWWGRSRLLNNWAEANAKVFFDFGDDCLWRLILFDSTKMVGAVGPIPRAVLIEDCKNGKAISVMAQIESGLDTPSDQV